MNMTITSKKQSQAKQDWMKENSKMYAIRVMKNTEPDLWDFLQSVSVPSATIKAALRFYMERHEEMKGEREMKQYRIKPEFWSSWGNEVDENTIVDENEVKRLSCEWGIPVDDLMEQLDEVDA